MCHQILLRVSFHVAHGMTLFVIPWVRTRKIFVSLISRNSRAARLMPSKDPNLGILSIRSALNRAPEDRHATLTPYSALCSPLGHNDDTLIQSQFYFANFMSHSWQFCSVNKFLKFIFVSELYENMLLSVINIGFSLFRCYLLLLFVIFLTENLVSFVTVIYWWLDVFRRLTKHAHIVSKIVSEDYPFVGLIRRLVVRN